MPRRFGPTLGTGVAVIEQDAASAITPSPLGVTCYVGRTEKGTPGEVLSVAKQRDFVRKCGTYLDESELPDSAFDFYRFSGGAGQLFVVRVTDGTEVEAVDVVQNRKTGSGDYLNRDTGSTQRGVMLTVAAKNGGRWGGAERVLSFAFTIVSDLDETTLATGETMLVDEWKGATLELFGVTSRTYTVISNTALGVLTVESDSRMASDLAADGATNNVATLTLDAATRSINAPGSVVGDRRELSLTWKDGEEDPDLLFGLDVLVDGSIVRSYPNLSLDPASKWYAGSVVNNDPDNDFVTLTLVHTGSYAAANRPAGWYGEFKAYASGTLTCRPVNVVSVVPNTPGNDIGSVTAWDFPSRTVRQRITLTFTGAAAFAVSTSAAYGAEHKDLPAGVVGTPYATTLAANNRTGLLSLPTFTVIPGVDAFEAGDVIVIDVDPLPVDLLTGDGLLEGWVYVNDGVTRERVAIESNTPDTIVFKSLPASAPTAASAIGGALQSTGDIVFPTAGGTIVVNCDLIGYATLTYGVVASAALLVAALEAEAVAAGLPSGLFTATGDKLNVLLSTIYAAASNETGADQFFEIVSAAAEVKLDAGVSSGASGDSFRVEAPRALRDGYDGSTPSDADYIAAFNTVTSPILRLANRKLGLIKLATPGVTSTNVQKAGLAFAEATNAQYRVEIPSNITSEASAVAYINATIARNDYGVTAWPSYGYVVNPVGNGTVLQSLTGAIHGIEARTAADFGGYHKAAAGLTAKLSHVIDLPTGESLLDTEILNPAGINPIVNKNGSFVVWGDRMISVQPAWRFKHAREYMSHTERVFAEAFDWILFALNNAETRKTLIPVFQAYFRPEWQKRAISGDTFEDAVSIKIDEENNSPADVENGDLNADISFAIVGVVERFNISVSKKGVLSSAA